MTKLRVALCALACVWAGQAMADSAASVSVLDTRWIVTALKDGIEPDASHFSRGTSRVAACIEGDVGLQCDWDEGPGNGWFASIDAPFGSAAADDRSASGWVVAPPSGATIFSASTYSSVGAGVGPWTSLTVELDLDIFAGGKNAEVTVTYSFATGSVYWFITESDSLLQGLRTLSLTVNNPSDDWLYGAEGRLLAVSGVSAVPEAPTALLLLAGIAGVLRHRAGSVRAAPPA